MTNLTRYEPWSAVRRMRDELQRGAADAASAWLPAVDIREEVDRFVIAADVPGVDPEAIEVTMEKDVLTIRGERNIDERDEDGSRLRRVERLHGTFYRRFTLPETADAENVSAQGRNGVLEVVIPKKAEVQPRRIEVAA